MDSAVIDFLFHGNFHPLNFLSGLFFFFFTSIKTDYNEVNSHEFVWIREKMWTLVNRELRHRFLPGRSTVTDFFIKTWLNDMDP